MLASPGLEVMTNVPWTHPRPLETPELSRVSEARILVKVLKVEAAAAAVPPPHVPLLIEVLAQVVAAPGLAAVSLPVTMMEGLRHVVLEDVEAGGGAPQLAGLAGHEADERRACQLLGRHHPRAGAGHPGVRSELTILTCDGGLLTSVRGERPWRGPGPGLRCGGGSWRGRGHNQRL